MGGNSNGDDVLRGKVRLTSLADLDRRTNAYRKTAELIDAVEADCGGADLLSTAERSIIRHAALTGAMIEDMGARWLAGEPIDPALYATLCNSERRLYETVGLRRRARDVVPDPLDYARERSP
jgi:hypothetical protein